MVQKPVITCTNIGHLLCPPGSVVGVSSECWLHPAGYVSPGLPGTDVWRAVRRGGQIGDTGGYNVLTNPQAQEVH